MYAEKVKENPSSLIQKKNTHTDSGSYGNKGINTASPNYCFAFARSVFSEPLPLSTTSHYYDADVVQLKGDKDDAAKLVATKHGGDPGKLGLTCHHIIPQSHLKKLYEICESYIKNKVNNEQFKTWNAVKVQFEAWKTNASASAEASADRRDLWTDDDDLALTACQWMSGNIFIGPNNISRLDDLGNKFDFGGYREKPVTRQRGKLRGYKAREDDSSNDKPSEYPDAKDAGNARMNLLLELYGNIEKIITKYNTKTCLNMSAEYIPILLNTLTELSGLAKYTGTLHLDPFSQTPIANASPPTAKTSPDAFAYNINDWVSVGKTRIKGMLNVHKKFVNMRKEYLNLLGSSVYTPSEKEFLNLFSKYIKSDVMENDFKFNSQMTMATYTFNLVNGKYNTLLASRRKRERMARRKKGAHRQMKGTNSSKETGSLNKSILDEIDLYDEGVI